MMRPPLSGGRAVQGLHMRILVTGGQGRSGLYNLGTGEATSINALLARLQAISGYSLEPGAGSAKAGETFRICLDSRRAHADRGWQPEITLTTSLQHSVDYFHEYEVEAG